MGPLCGVFDKRAAERLNRHADSLGFDAISAGGVLAWLMECLDSRLLTPGEAGATGLPVFDPAGFSVEADSMQNAAIGVEILDAIVERRGILDMGMGARRFARTLAHERGKNVLDLFVYNANARSGWMVPNQYWTAGVLSPMPIMGKYFMHYGDEFYPPRELGRRNAARFVKELVIDNAGFCRFHRNWAEEMIPGIFGTLYGGGDGYVRAAETTARRINNRNNAVFWESERAVDFIHSFLVRKHEVDGDNSAELLRWIDHFGKNKPEAALDFWFEISKGVHESLREF
jgi:glyceraldehyde-3-phosphate dehydrogenase (ferredoxin)